MFAFLTKAGAHDAKESLGGDVGNRGAEAADAALEMADFAMRARRARG